jgi:hypothetical protein
MTLVAGFAVAVLLAGVVAARTIGYLYGDSLWIEQAITRTTAGHSIGANDAYVKADLEVDGVVYADGGVTGAITGNATTATALASNPTDCSANQFATTIAANGNLTCAAVTQVGALTATGAIGATGAITSAVSVSAPFMTMTAMAAPGATGTCAAGTVQMDATYIYGCTSTNNWKKVAWTEY